MDISRHSKQEDNVPQDKPRVRKPPEVIGQIVGEVSSLDVAVAAGEDKRKECGGDGVGFTLHRQRENKYPKNKTSERVCRGFCLANYCKNVITFPQLQAPFSLGQRS